MRRYLRTDEREETVRSLEWAELQSRALDRDPYLWKWILISLHNATQGVMVLALWNGNGLLTLTSKGAKEWLEAYRTEKPYPPDRLDRFMNLYVKAKRSSSFSRIGSGPFCAGSTHDHSIALLNDLRNEFIHFTPKGWSLQLTGLPRVCLDALEFIDFFVNQSTAIIWHKPALRIRMTRTIRRLRRKLQSLKVKYDG